MYSPVPVLAVLGAPFGPRPSLCVSRGQVAARYASDVTLTDYEPAVLQLAACNVGANATATQAAGGSAVRVRRLPWCRDPLDPSPKSCVEASAPGTAAAEDVEALEGAPPEAEAEAEAVLVRWEEAEAEVTPHDVSSRDLES